MDWKQKLSQLRAPRAPRALPSAPFGDEREESLAHLRRQMAAILEREPPPRAAAVSDVSDATHVSELPFVRVETATGPLYQYLEHLRPSHHIGTIPVDAALAAGADVIALLALDPRLAAVDPARVLFLDTETTGLSGSGTIAFLVGLGWFDSGTLVIEQLLLRTPANEEPLLRHIAQRIEEASFLVTFNGKAFDMPMLNGRYVMNRLPPPPDRPHFDLLHVARRLHRSRIRACTLKAVESEVLGFVRDADIDGGDVAPRYAHFLRTGDESALRAVVDHNAWDVISMAALVGLYGEPLGTLHGEDLVGLARTYRRARAFDRAEEAADVAVRRGAGPEGLRVRGEIAKARGDRQRALTEFEALVAAVDDPRARLELSKLYEHFLKEPAMALELTHQGTGEPPEATARRRSRLERKVLSARAKT